MGMSVNVLEAQRFKGVGILLYCTNSEIQSLSKDEIVLRLGNPKRIIFGKETTREFPIDTVSPMISFTDNAAVMVKVAVNDFPVDVFPATALIE